jgi:hypothetical protein
MLGLKSRLAKIANRLGGWRFSNNRQPVTGNRFFKKKPSKLEMDVVLVQLLAGWEYTTFKTKKKRF